MATQRDINPAVFYLPFAYYYRVRLQTPAKLLSWCLIYPAVCLYFAAMASGGITWQLLLDFALILVAVFTLYESGYIHNDTIAILHEENPTQRLNQTTLAYAYAHIRKYHNVRWAIAGVCALILLIIHDFEPVWTQTAMLIWCVPILFSIYNLWRSHHNVWLYPVLVCSRYVPLLYPFINGNWRLMLLMVLTFPLVNALERFSMPKYRYPVMRRLIPTEQSKTLFRVGYYTLVSIIVTCFYVLRGLPVIELTPIYVMGLYRLSISILTIFHTPKNYLHG